MKIAWSRRRKIKKRPAPATRIDPYYKKVVICLLISSLLPYYRHGGGGEGADEEEEDDDDETYRSLVEYSRTATTTTLHQDVAGLKLFLDILNGPDNPEAEAELRCESVLMFVRGTEPLAGHTGHSE